MAGSGPADPGFESPPGYQLLCLTYLTRVPYLMLVLPKTAEIAYALNCLHECLRAEKGGTWCGRRDSNPGSAAWKAAILPG